MPRTKEKQDAYDRTVNRRYGKAKTRAKRDKRAFSLSLKQYKALIDKDECAYCGEGLEQTGSSLDRVDSKYGYTEKNVVTCCRKCNTMKSNLTLEEFYKHIKKVMEYVKL